LAAADKSGGSDKQYCKIHHTKGQDLQNCRQVKLLAEKQKAKCERRDKEKGQDGAEGSGKKRGSQGGHRGKDNQQERPARGREKKQEDDDHDESSEHEFQKATEAMCVDGGASLHTSHRQLKQSAREITAAEPSFDAQKPLKWSSTPIIFDTEDHPDRTTAVGCLPLLVSPTIRNLKGTKMRLIDLSGPYKIGKKKNEAILHCLTMIDPAT
jgi:hypothetical protein